MSGSNADKRSTKLSQPFLGRTLVTLCECVLYAFTAPLIIVGKRQDVGHNTQWQEITLETEE